MNLSEIIRFVIYHLWTRAYLGCAAVVVIFIKRRFIAIIIFIWDIYYDGLKSHQQSILDGLVVMISACHLRKIKRGRPGFDSLSGRYFFFSFFFGSQEWAFFLSERLQSYQRTSEWSFSVVSGFVTSWPWRTWQRIWSRLTRNHGQWRSPYKCHIYRY